MVITYARIKDGNSSQTGDTIMIAKGDGELNKMLSSSISIARLEQFMTVDDSEVSGFPMHEPWSLLH